MRYALIPVLLMLSLSGICAAANYYVDGEITKDCSDYSPQGRVCGGGADDASTSLSRAMAKLHPGDTLILRAGRYGQIRPPRSGTATKPIEIKAMANETAVISSGEVALWLINRSDIIIADLEVVDVEGFGRLENSSRIQINNLRFRNAGASGTTGALKFVRSQFNRVQNSSFDGGSDLLLLQDDSNQNLVSGNFFGSASHSLISIRCSSENIIRANVFNNPKQKALEVFDCEGVSDAPVRLQDTRRNVIEFNRFVGTAPSSKSHYYNAIQHGGQFGIVRYNLFSDNRGGGVNFQYYSQESLHVYGNRLYNNTFYNNRCFGIIGQRGPKERFHDNRAVNNLLYQNSNCQGGGGEQTSIVSSAQVILSSNAELSADPGFVDPSKGDFSLGPSSKMIDRGEFIAAARHTGSGRELAVDDASWFTTGFGIEGESGDLIRIVGHDAAIAIVDIDYEANILRLARDATWKKGDGVHVVYQGQAPDMGAFEYTQP